MKKILLGVLKWLIILLIVLIVGAYISGNGYLIKGISCTYLKGHTTAHIYDLEYFDSREVKNGVAMPWTNSHKLGKLELTDAEEKTHQRYKSVAYLVIKDDQVLFEKYWGEHSEIAVSNSFSMAKSMVALLIGAALDEGLIGSVEDSACDYIPELCKDMPNNNEITIKDLLTMTSTIDFDESYGDPFGFMARTTYGSDLAAETYDGFQAQKEPGSEWRYLGGNTLLLGFIVENVTHKNLSNYMSEKIWQKIGAEHPAHWALDSDGGREKSYCCFNATTRDFAKLGKLMLQCGEWNDEQIIGSKFMEEMMTPLSTPAYSDGEQADHYGYQIWLDQRDGKKVVNYRGMLGQYISIIPDDELIIVRLGHARGKKDNHCPSDLNEWIKMGQRMAVEE